MSVRLTEACCWKVIAESHTGILTTLQREGWPVSLPVWFCVIDQTIYVRTPLASRKVARIRSDERACFLVESGRAWSELRAVELRVVAEIVEAAETIARAESALNAKYEAFRPRREAMPESSRRHYGRGNAIIALRPAGPPLSWDNRRIAVAPTTS
jgi:nitroimidazol reductase NimA-like FMN-containing flavoprotein (pyridoxamine 5'-phosphate oxidase superfamily)